MRPASLIRATLLAVMVGSTTLACGTFGQRGGRSEAARVEAALEEAASLQQSGLHAESRQVLEVLHARHPNVPMLATALATARATTQDYDGAMALLLPILATPSRANHLHYALAGTVHLAAGRPDAARDVVKRGLERFRGAGLLYEVLGTIALRGADDGPAAIVAWEAGMAMDPQHPGNYFYAAQVANATGEHGLAIIYGEVFMNLEADSGHTETMSELLVAAYEAAIIPTAKDGERGVQLAFTKQDSVEAAADGDVPFVVAFELAHLPGVVAHGTRINLDTLVAIRSTLVATWEKNPGFSGRHPLMDWLSTTADAGHLEAYNRFVLRAAFPREFEAWKSDNPQQWDAFVAWFQRNDIHLGRRGVGQLRGAMAQAAAKAQATRQPAGTTREL